ncbi:universal stress protein [Algoriphagus winogradskyi]|uniref:Nucleotide-binding universal stress protein, UspA family n=1 Tax=Algoriphagus winogradskyi TaxID=237017 RepID=A0ABY1PHE8_9BACT|nr:universal stress protein [Algoriphagus winogradskyi]SMP32650.1 Nucleotide-binding universal stress protein, UspA family [Algoriphagus winogradskyi]
MKIILPIDFSENSINALDFAIALAGKKDGEIILVHVIEAVFDFASQASVAMESMHRDAQALMQNTLEKYKVTNLIFQTIIKEGTASISIARIARELDATLVVMGTQGASGIKLALIGSTTVNLIKESSVPVLVVPAESIAADIRKVALALEFASHEEKFIGWVIDMSRRWDRGIEFVHVQTSNDFEEDPGIKNLEDLIVKQYPGLPLKIHTFYARTPIEGLDQFLEENENVILVMCHQHKNLWEQVLSRSQTIQMVFHSKVPLLVMT